MGTRDQPCQNMFVQRVNTWNLTSYQPNRVISGYLCCRTDQSNVNLRTVQSKSIKIKDFVLKRSVDFTSIFESIAGLDVQDTTKWLVARLLPSTTTLKFGTTQSCSRNPTNQIKAAASSRKANNDTWRCGVHQSR